MKTFTVLVLLLVSAVSAFDFIREAFKNINSKVDPCDNFYRHACPINPSYGNLVVKEYEDLIFKLRVQTADAVWNNLEIEKTFKRTHYKEILSPAQHIADLFKEKCDDEYVSIEELEIYLHYIERNLFGTENSKCEFNFCLSALASDHNCTRSTETLRDTLASSKLDITKEFELRNGGFFEVVRTGLEGSNAVLDGDIRDGVANVEAFVESMKIKLISWINQTSWAVNNDAEAALIIEALQVHLSDNYGKSLRDNLEILFKTEQDYLKCVRDTKNDEGHQVFCMIMALSAVKTDPEAPFFTYFNAMNGHPNLYFSHILYDMAKNVEELAGVLGSVGYIAGHELSHTLIENPNQPELLPYFSNESVQCIQNQYQKTCDSFKEVSCGAQDPQIDENGADMLGMQLAYSLFEDAYQGRMKEEYIRIATADPNSYQSITMEQLFFYSTAFVSCKGMPLGQRIDDPHSPYNVRINAVVQHPGFRQAFNCASDSAMVQSFNDQCIIFGEGAPELRK